jgi:predicted O-methyltransferase YrrM
MWDPNEWERHRTTDEHGSIMSMDPAHVLRIYDFVMATRPAHAIEIGSWDGYSTSALVQARRDGWLGQITIIDVQARALLKSILPPSRCKVYEMDSFDALQVCGVADLAIIDGEHSFKRVCGEWAMLSRRGVDSVIAHDCGRRGEPGPQWLLEELRRFRNWRVWLDDLPRAGFHTDRGLMIASRSETAIANVPELAADQAAAAELPAAVRTDSQEKQAKPKHRKR